MLLVAIIASGLVNPTIELPASLVELETAPVSDARLAELASAPAPRVAADEGVNFSYTYVEVGATQLSVDDASLNSEDVDSYYLKGSLALGMFHIFAQYEDQKLDFMDTNTDLYRLGAGVHFGVMPKLDLIGEVAWLYSDISSDITQLDDTTDGWEARAGARWMTLAWDGGGLELDGNLTYVDLENRLASDDAATGFELGARAHFLRLLSVGAMYSIIGDDDQINLNLRVSF